MSVLHHECGVAAIYHLDGEEVSPLCTSHGPSEATRLMPRMLLDIQNRGQLSAGMSSYNPDRQQLLDTHRKLGTVTQAFRLNHKAKAESVMREYAGRAAIGHVRYATCGADDCSYAQPFERHHLQKNKWFSFAFNGQLANYTELRDKLLEEDAHHLTRDNDTEIMMHEISRELSGDRRMPMIDVMRHLATRFDGAYTLAMLNAQGEMMVARDPLGMKPMCYAIEGPLFAAASESVALVNLGFKSESIKSLEPGTAVIVSNNKFTIERFADNPRRAHCFFEWIYFANVASTLDDRSVYLSRKALGEELAKLEDLDCDEDTIVVPVPDTSKAAADAMAFQLGVPSIEGLIRNRYSGRTFIEGGSDRAAKAAIKYTPLPEVLEGKKILLVEDSIVRSTTMRVLIKKIREIGKVKEIHIRVACPPIVAPCFYGIAMSTIGELFAPDYVERVRSGEITETEMFEAMAKELGAESIRYLPIDSIARAIQKPGDQICQACLTGSYPTPHGQRLYDIELKSYESNSESEATSDFVNG